MVRGDELLDSSAEGIQQIPRSSGQGPVAGQVPPPRGRCQTRPERNSTKAPRASCPGIRHAIWHTFPGKGLHPVGKPSGCSQNITPYWPIQPLYNPYSYIGGICWYISQVLSQGYPTSRVPNLELALWRFPQREGFRLGTNQNLGFN